MKQYRIKPQFWDAAERLLGKNDFNVRLKFYFESAMYYRLCDFNVMQVFCEEVHEDKESEIREEQLKDAEEKSIKNLDKLLEKNISDKLDRIAGIMEEMLLNYQNKNR